MIKAIRRWLANLIAPTDKRIGSWRCCYCGSDHVQCQMWVDANTGEVLDATERYSWCNQCDDEGRDGEQKYLEFVLNDGNVQTWDHKQQRWSYHKFVPEIPGWSRAHGRRQPGHSVLGVRRKTSLRTHNKGQD